MRDMVQFYINGEWVDPVTPNTMEVYNPASGDVCGQISLGSVADVDKAVSAAFGLAGNTMTVSHIGACAAAAATTGATGKFSKAAVAAYTTVAISRSLTSGATLAATYKSSDESLTLKASVAF